MVIAYIGLSLHYRSATAIRQEETYSNFLVKRLGHLPGGCKITALKQMA